MNLSNFENDFSTWKLKIDRELPLIFEIASRRLPEAPEELIRSLTLIEGHYARLGTLLAEIGVFLDMGAKLYLPGKETGLSELDRKTSMKGDIAVIQGYHNQIENILDAVKQKIILGESILRYASQFVERNRTITSSRMAEETPF